MAGQMENKLEIGDLSKITTYQAGAIQAAAHRTLRDYCDTVLSAYGISKLQWVVIGMALDAGEAGARLIDIQQYLDLTPYKLTGIVRTLEKQNMVVRRNKGRHKAIAIHPVFAQDCPEIERILRKAMRDSIYSAVTPLEFRVYLKVLYQLSLLKEQGN